MSASPDREAYRPSGRVNAGRFTPILFLAFLTAICIGGLLCVAWHTGTFFLGLTPLFASLAVGALVFVAIHTGHCRNSFLAVAVGAASGAMAILAAYQFDFAFYTGWSNLARLDRLPDHIRFRIQNDGAIQPDGSHEPSPPGVNLAELLFNAAIVILLPIGTAWRAVRRPFCENRQRWMDTFQCVISVESGASVIEALRAGDVAALLTAIEAAPTVAAEYVKAEMLYVPRAADSSAYLTLSRVTLNQKSRELVHERALVKRWRLSAEEAAVLAEGFHISDAGFARSERGQPESGPAHGDDAALYVEFNENRVFGERTRALVGTMIHAPLGICTAMAFVCWLGALGSEYVWPERPAWIVFAAVPAGFGFLFGAVGLARFINVIPARYLYARLCREIMTRSDAIVQPDDTDAIFVEVVPRRNWVPSNNENADDFGLLRVDRERGLILFEGGAERWTLPASAVIGCEVSEYCAHPQTGEPANIPLLVLTAIVNGHEWERPLNPRSREWARLDVTARRAAIDVLRYAVSRVLPAELTALPSLRGR